MSQLLSKSKFLAGRQCLKRLYLEVHSPELAAPVSEAQQAIFDQGTRVGELARGRWPDGVLVSAPYFRHDDAVDQAGGLLADTSVTAVFEGGFKALGTRIRADVLERDSNGHGWNLIEVKSSTGAKPVHDEDIAVQLAVLREAGVRVNRCILLAVDNSYIYEGGAVDLTRFFKPIDRTHQTSGMQEEVHYQLEEMQRAIAAASPPGIEPGLHCRKPYECAFLGHCTKNSPEHWIMELPRINPGRLEKLRSAGIESIGDIPGSFNLTPDQARVRQAVLSGEPVVSDDLRASLLEPESPIHYLDFETSNPAIPLYPGTRPYERIPFQWSCHTEGDGELEHAGFLAEGSEDPRRAFAESLLEAVGDEGTIVTYSTYEGDVLAGLASLFPDLAGRLRAVIERIWDLRARIAKGYYHPGFHGSTSLKAVLPVLAPEISYADLAIGDGGTANVKFQAMMAGDMSPEEARETASDLEAYCALDTLAMVRVRERLLQQTEA